jgi:uncharacterized protein YjbI with pentapeptide repeats
MNIEELLERYSAGERDFSSIRALKHLKVPRSQDFSGISLQGCNLHEVDFSEVILVGADLSGVTCSQANFRNANFRSANISAATLWEETDLSGTDLSYANLRKLTVEDAIFQGAVLIGADLSESYIKGADFRSASFATVNLHDAWISSSNFRDADLAGVDLSTMKQWALNETAGAKFDGAIMPGSQPLKDDLNTAPEILKQIHPEDIEIIKKDYLQFGDQLSAIKFLRRKTGWDLSQAKSAVDLIWAQLRS